MKNSPLAIHTTLLLTLGLAAPLAAQNTPVAPPTNATTPGKDVLLLRDLNGTAHVYSRSDAGAYFGAGYAAAQDRFFQMSWRRLIYQGRVAEFFGPGTVGNKDTHTDSDIRMRTFGVARHAAKVASNLDAETLSLLQAYCDGVNAYLAEPSTTLHPFFNQYGVPVENWTPADCIGLWFVIGAKFQTDGLGEGAVLHDFLDLMNQGYSREQAADMLDGDIVDDDSAAVITQSDVPPETQQAMQDYVDQNGLTGGSSPDPDADFTFSHAWTVAGSHTQTGNAMMVGDPRVTVFIPNLFYEWSMQGKTFSVSGMGVPGVPNILAGRSATTAWSPTALGMDQADLFTLTTDDVNHPGQYLLDGVWRDFDVDETETVIVLGGTNETVHYRHTSWGPVVTELAADVQPNEEYALRMVPLHDPSVDSSTGFLAMYRAADVYELFSAMGAWHFPSTNMVLADADGNIGYVANGAMPVRNPVLPLAGLMAQNGAFSASGWLDLLPQHLKPHVFNPADGYLLTANHMPVGTWYPIPTRYGTGSHGDGVRSRRIRELLSAVGSNFSARDVLDVHHDTVNVGFRDFVVLGLHLRDGQSVYRPSTDALSCLTHLEPWLNAGATLDNQHHGTALASQMELMFRPNTAGDLAITFGGGGNGLNLFLKTMLDKISQSQALSNEEAEYIDQVLADAYRQMIGIEPDSNQWQQWYADNHLNIDLPHWTSLEGFPSLDPGTTTSVTVTTANGGTLLSPKAQSFTQFAEVGTENHVTVMPLGAAESGTYANDQQALWESEQFKLSPLSLGRHFHIGYSSLTWLSQ